MAADRVKTTSSLRPNTRLPASLGSGHTGVVSRTCRPQQPTAFMMEALWMTLYGIPACTALRTRSLCVVALQEHSETFTHEASSTN